MSKKIITANSIFNIFITSLYQICKKYQNNDILSIDFALYGVCMRSFILVLLSIFIVAGCGGSNSINNGKINDTEKVLNSATTWQWQLQGELNKSYDVKVYDIDLFDTNKSTIKELQASGKIVICYFSAGSYEKWRDDADSFPQEALGEKMDGWDERWLDIRNSQIKTIMQNRLKLAKEKGCDGVEPDNVDGYSNNTGFSLNPQEQIKFNKYLAKEAKYLGLLIGLKNDLNQIKELEPYFDFALNEQCHEYNECELLSPFIESIKPVFNAEYAKKYVDNTNGARDKLCTDAKARDFRTLVLPLDLDGSFRFSCD